jgi:hypothetical protein
MRCVACTQLSLLVRAGQASRRGENDRRPTGRSPLSLSEKSRNSGRNSGCRHASPISKPAAMNATFIATPFIEASMAEQTDRTSRNFQERLPGGLWWASNKAHHSVYMNLQP